MAVVLTALLPLLLIVLLGVLFRAFRIADSMWVTILNRFGLYVAFPAVIVHSFIKADKSQILDLPVIGLNIVLLLLVFFTAFLLTRGLRDRKQLANTYIIGAFFGNIGYLGYPYISAMIPGSEGMISMHISMYNILLFTLGIAHLEHSKGHLTCKKTIVNKIISNPLLISVAVGLLILITGVQLPEFISKPIDLLYRSATPVVLFALGVFLYRKYSWRAWIPHILGMTVIRLVLVPGLFLLAMVLLSPGVNFRVSVLEAGMPLALTPFALAEEYPLEREVIAPAVLLSTLLSPLSLAALLRIVS